jgi:iron-sulfur cluster repair protein YtfE (RIC family)
MASVLEGFSADHRRLEELLVALIGAVESSDLERARRAMATYVRESRRHSRVEDDVLFAGFEERTGMRDTGPTVILRRDHQEIDRRLDQLSGALVNASTAHEALFQVRALQALLHDHRKREETILFPVCDRLLDAAVRAAAVRELGVPRGAGE